MICRFCSERPTCTSLCEVLELYVSQDVNPVGEELIDDLVTNTWSCCFTNRFEDVYSTLNDKRELDQPTFEGINLPLRQRQCMELYYFGNKSIDEISRLLGIKPITVKVLKLRGVKRLAKHFGIPYKRILGLSHKSGRGGKFERVGSDKKMVILHQTLIRDDKPIKLIRDNKPLELIRDVPLLKLIRD